MKNFKNLWISIICLLVFLLLLGPLSSTALASDHKLTAERYKDLPDEEKKRIFATLNKQREAKRLNRPEIYKRFCGLGKLSIIAGPNPGKPKSRKPAVKFPKRVRCPNNASKFCSEWRYHFSWKGSVGKLKSVRLSFPLHLKLLSKVASKYGTTVCTDKTAANQNPPSSRKIPGPENLSKSSFESRWIDCEVDPSAKRIDVSFITPLAKAGIASAGGFVSPGSHNYCVIAGAGIRNVKPLGSSPNIQCFPPMKGDIVGVEITRDPDSNLDVETGLRFLVPFQGCDLKIKSNTAIKPLVVKSDFTTCGSSKGGSLCLIKNPKVPKSTQTYSISDGNGGRAGLICVDFQNAQPKKDCDITGTDPDHYCKTFYCDTGGPLPKCDGKTYACVP